MFQPASRTIRVGLAFVQEGGSPRFWPSHYAAFSPRSIRSNGSRKTRMRFPILMVGISPRFAALYA